MASKDAKKEGAPGGIKGFLQRAGNSFYVGGIYAKEKAWMLAKMGAHAGFVVSTISIVVLMPLIFEIMREGQLIEADKLQVKDLRHQGYSDPQLQQMGFPKSALDLAPAALRKT